MSITSSSFVLGVAQLDGRIPCTETHTDNTGVIYTRTYLSAAGADNQAIMVAFATVLDSDIKTAELNQAIFSLPWDYVLKYATNNELAALVRSLYRDSKKETLALVAKRILEWIANGRFTDNQVRNAFGLDAVSWTLLKTKMQNLVAKYDDIQSAEGE